MFKFKASIHKINIDAEGESTLILKIPKSDILEIAKLTQATEVELNVKIDMQNVD